MIFAITLFKIMKHLKFSTLIIALLILLSFKSSENKKFPTISGVTLADKNITLPNTSKKKFCLVAVASSMKAEEDLIGWIDPVSKTLMGNMMFQVDMYFIPMTGGIKGVSNDVVKRKLKESMDSSLYNYVLLYTGPIEQYVKELNMRDRDLPYFYVINPRGEITYTTSGKYTEDKLDEIVDKLSD
jgi:hypothetical protein